MPDLDHNLRPGVALFNNGAYFEAHEHLEALWLHAPPVQRFFLQALIHMAVAWLHSVEGNREGALRQVEKGLRKLAGYLPERAGVDTAALYQDAQRWRTAWRADLPIAEPATIGLKR
jgi:predicted metal-dependent hydrolase